MILHQGDRYVCNGTQVHPGSLNFLKSSLEIGVKRIMKNVLVCSISLFHLEKLNETSDDLL